MLIFDRLTISYSVHFSALGFTVNPKAISLTLYRREKEGFWAVRGKRSALPVTGPMEVTEVNV